MPQRLKALDYTEINISEYRPSYTSFCKVGIAEVGAAQVGAAEVGTAEVGIDEVGAAKVRLYVWMLLPPLVPCLHALSEDIKMFLACHALSSPFVSSCCVPQP